MCVLLLLELASDGLKGRVFEVAQADLQGDEVAHRKFKLISEDVQGKHVLTNFHGMSLTTDKIKSLIKKWQVHLTSFLSLSESVTFSQHSCFKKYRQNTMCTHAHKNQDCISTALFLSHTHITLARSLSHRP